MGFQGRSATAVLCLSILLVGSIQACVVEQLQNLSGLLVVSQALQVGMLLWICHAWMVDCRQGCNGTHGLPRASQAAELAGALETPTTSVTLLAPSDVAFQKFLLEVRLRSACFLRWRRLPREDRCLIGRGGEGPRGCSFPSLSRSPQKP